MTERPLTAALRRDGEALSLKEYEQAGGYRAIRAALRSMTPKGIQDFVKDANLRGRGGAGFPTCVKWGLMPPVDSVPSPRYLIANVDEMEPGTFKDRMLIEGNPHQLIEGIVVSAFATQADIAYIFLRWEYRRCAERLNKAIAEASDAGYLGKNILGSGYSLNLQLHTSAGRYICGEETAMLNALEGQRPVPRSKPPHPQVSGLWGRPTVIDNTETLCNVPHIVNNGAAWFRGLSRCEDGGTKIYGVSGRVKRPGWWELPMGTPLREILEGHAGGMRDGHRFRGVMPGGASTDFLVEEHLDVPMDFNAVPKAGSRMGTGMMIVLDDRTCPVAMLYVLERFFARESCGWCTPCREGLSWVAKTLRAIEEGQGRPGDIELLERHTRLLGPGNTFCALAPGAMEPLQSALRYFREDFESHIRGRRCPWQ